MPFNTNNPIGSVDPRDLIDNAPIVDEFANSDAPTVSNRLGQQRKTMKGMEQEFTGNETARESAFVASQAGRSQRFADALAAASIAA